MQAQLENQPKAKQHVSESTQKASTISFFTSPNAMYPLVPPLMTAFDVLK
jgi:hypothetical protein